MSRTCKPLALEYYNSGALLETVTSIKYLGVTLQSDMKWKQHIRAVVGKASYRLRFAGRALGKCISSVKETAYKTLVLHILEYCSSVWDLVGLREDVELVRGLLLDL